MSSGPWPMISLMTAEPPEITLKVTCKLRPSEAFDSQVPGIVLIVLKAFWASVWACPVAATAMISSSGSNGRTDFSMGVSFLSSFLFSRLRMFVFCLQFFGVFLFHKGLQACEIRAPEGSVLLNPGVDGAE